MVAGSDLPDGFVPLDERSLGMLEFVRRQRHLVDRAILSAIDTDDSSSTAEVLLPMLWAIGNTSVGIERLAAAGHFREVYVIGRGLVESIVNVLFILAGGRGSCPAGSAPRDAEVLS